MLLGCYASLGRHAVVNVGRKRMSGFFACHSRSFILGWLINPGCSLFEKKQLRQFRATPQGLSERCFQRVLLATFSIRPLHATTEAFSPPFPHFDPFGTEFCEPGRISHPNYKDPSSFRRSSWRPRASRDFTVPTLMSSAVAISSYAKPSMSLSTTASR